MSEVKEGDRVRIERGPFDGEYGTVRSVDPKPVTVQTDHGGWAQLVTSAVTRIQRPAREFAVGDRVVTEWGEVGVVEEVRSPAAYVRLDRGGGRWWLMSRLYPGPVLRVGDRVVVTGTAPRTHWSVSGMRGTVTKAGTREPCLRGTLPGDREVHVELDELVPGTSHTYALWWRVEDVRHADADQHDDPAARPAEQILADAAREILAKPEWAYAQDRKHVAPADAMSITVGHLRALARRSRPVEERDG